MPNLPEVETIRRPLAPHVERRVLERGEVLDPRWCEPAPPSAVEDATRGRRIERLGRRGKYIVLELEDDVHLVMHLRMTGNLLLAHDAPYTRVRMELAGGGDRVLFTDPRRFGTGVVLLGVDARDEYFDARLGPEPLDPDFTADALRAMAAGRRAPVKAFLLSQDRIAGVGNIYADEALWRARIHPLRPVGTLRRTQIEALRDGVVESLEAGSDARGAPLDDLPHPHGPRGPFQAPIPLHRPPRGACPRRG